MSGFLKMWSLEQEITGCWVLGGWLGEGLAGWEVGCLCLPHDQVKLGQVGCAAGRWWDLSARARSASLWHFIPGPSHPTSLFSLAARSFELIMMRECKCQRDPSFNLSC